MSINNFLYPSPKHRFTPISQVTPYTLKDSYSLLEQLNVLHTKMSEIVDEINTVNKQNIDVIDDEFNGFSQNIVDEITDLNNDFAVLREDVTRTLRGLNDSTLAEVLGNSDSLTREQLRTVPINMVELTSPNGTVFRVTVENSGVLTTQKKQ